MSKRSLIFVQKCLNSENFVVNFDYRHAVFRSTPPSWPNKAGFNVHPPIHIYSVSQKKPRGDLTFFHFFHKRLRICNRFFTHLLTVLIIARLQIFIQLSPKLYHIKRDYPVHIICAKCPKRAIRRAFRRLRKSLIALLIVVCGKSLKNKHFLWCHQTCWIWHDVNNDVICSLCKPRS